MAPLDNFAREMQSRALTMMYIDIENGNSYSVENARRELEIIEQTNRISGTHYQSFELVDVAMRLQDISGCALSQPLMR
jgi:hypothetical protein